jgi:multidrug resistance protein
MWFSRFLKTESKPAPKGLARCVDLEAANLADDHHHAINLADESHHKKRIDQSTVHWDGPDDPNNPRNWSSAKKSINIAFISALCFLTPVASAMFAPGVPKLMIEFHSTNEELGTFVVSIFVLGFATGPMFLAPLSEIYGRLPIYHITNVIFIAFTVACAVSKNFAMLVPFRFLAGVAGSAPLANGGGTISDLIKQEKRGAAMALFGIGPLLGPVIGPVAGGYLTEAAGWRWVFWLIAIAVCYMILISKSFADEMIDGFPIPPNVALRQRNIRQSPSGTQGLKTLS